MGRNRIYLIGKTTEDDRLQLASILIKTGYSVRIGKEKVSGKKTSTYFVEYWTEMEEQTK